MASKSEDVQSSSCENPGATSTTLEVYSTDDESTGQRCSAVRERQQHAEVTLKKMISKHKSDSMFELRKLSLHQRPVSEFCSKRTLEEFFANRPQLVPYRDDDTTEDGAESAREQQPESNNMESAGDSPQVQGNAEELVQNNTSSEDGAAEEPTTESLRPEHILNDMQALQELRVVHGILQGPVHEQIDQTLQENLAREQQHGQRRPRPRSRPRSAQAVAEESEEGGDEMNNVPVGRLLAAGGHSRRQRGSRGRRVRFRSQIPTPNPDGRYPVPRRDQTVIVDRLRQSPALNSLGEEARDEIVAEVGNLVSQQLVTSALAGDFRGVLELHIQSRAEQINHGNGRPPIGQRYPQQYYGEDDEPAVAPSAAGIRELREEMMMMKGQLNELKQMMRVSFDLQLDIQRAVRQEVSAALSAFLASPAAAGGGSGRAQANCPIPTLAQGNISYGGRAGAQVRVADSGHCVICSEGTIDSVIYHCGHMCTCMACGLEMKSKALKCPICRAPITDVIRAYTSML